MLPLKSISATHVLGIIHLEVHLPTQQLFTSGRDGFLAIFDISSISPKVIVNCRNGTILPKTGHLDQIELEKLSSNRVMTLNAEKEYVFVFNANNTLQLYHIGSEMMVNAKVFRGSVTCAVFDDNDVKLLKIF